MATLPMQSRREGFALPMAIMLVGFLTAGLVAGFTRQNNETRILSDNSEQTNAFAVAQAGLERYMAAGTVTSTTATYTFSKGTATITAYQVKSAPLSTDTAIWLIKSTGVTNGGTAKRPAARRTVAQLAYRAPASMQVLSSWTSLSGIRKNGASGDVSGADACGKTATKAGAAVPTGGIEGKEGPFSGDPDIQEMGTPQEMAAQIKIDWAGITSTTNPVLAADIIICKAGTSGYSSARTPCGSWPSSFPTDYWPTIIINGSSALPGNGHGMLIITGDLTLGGGDQWDGIIMVGGILTDNGNGGINGAVVTGLNVKLGQTVGESSKANGTKDYNFDSCDVASATSGMIKLAAVENAWMDNWSAW